MSAKKTTPLDLEHNLFERSFGSKDLLDAHQPDYSLTNSTQDRDSLSHSAAGSKDSPNSLGQSSASASSGGIEMKPKTHLGVEQPNPANNTRASEPITAPPTSDSKDSNKHNLKLSNFQSVRSERLPGLTPPLFTPGGPRLPPIHPSPGLPLGSPGTPGSNMWSSLLNVTNGNTNTHEQYNHTNHNPYLTMARKASGLNPNESNLRSGLTPGGVNHNGFNFMLSNIPDGLGNGQMTPGLQTLLGLAGTSTTNIGESQSQLPNGPVPPQTQINYPIPPQPGSIPYPSSDPPTNTDQVNTMPSAPSDEAVAVKKEEAADRRDHANKAKSSKGNASSKPKEKPKSGTKRTNSNEPEKLKKAAKSNAPGKATPEVKHDPEEPDNGDSPLNEEAKRKQFLERNRVAASKCRQRKKQLFTKMESELSFYSKGFRDVSAQVTQLREQLMTVRGILLSHKDCPGLVNAAGGYQQFQNILAQTEFMAQVSNASESNYTSMPSTVPTTLNTTIPPAKQMDTQPRGEMFSAGDVNANQNQGRDHSAIIPVVPRSINGGINGNAVMHAGIDERVPFEHDMSLPRQEENVPQDAFESMQSMANKDNLRTINSASNLQSVKMGTSASNLGLRPIASMADMQSQNSHPNQGVYPKQFQL